MKVEVWSDVACPWCYIGKVRFERAVAEFGKPVDVTYRSYQLDPSLPAHDPRGEVDYLVEPKQSVSLGASRPSTRNCTPIGTPSQLSSLKHPQPACWTYPASAQSGLFPVLWTRV